MDGSPCRFGGPPSRWWCHFVGTRIHLDLRPRCTTRRSCHRRAPHTSRRSTTTGGRFVRRGHGGSRRAGGSMRRRRGAPRRFLMSRAQRSSSLADDHAGARSHGGSLSGRTRYRRRARQSRRTRHPERIRHDLRMHRPRALAKFSVLPTRNARAAAVELERRLRRQLHFAAAVKPEPWKNNDRPMPLWCLPLAPLLLELRPLHRLRGARAGRWRPCRVS